MSLYAVGYFISLILFAISILRPKFKYFRLPCLFTIPGFIYFVIYNDSKDYIFSAFFAVAHIGFMLLFAYLHEDGNDWINEGED